MARRATRPTIDEAEAAGTLARLVDAGVDRSVAEAWVAAWEHEAGTRGLSPTDVDYWPTGEAWIALRRAQDPNAERRWGGSRDVIVTIVAATFLAFLFVYIVASCAFAGWGDRVG